MQSLQSLQSLPFSSITLERYFVFPLYSDGGASEDSDAFLDESDLEPFLVMVTGMDRVSEEYTASSSSGDSLCLVMLTKSCEMYSFLKVVWRSATQKSYFSAFVSTILLLEGVKNTGKKESVFPC